MGQVRVKICGLRTEADVAAAAGAGAAYAGFVFFERSPRHLTVAQARALAIAALYSLYRFCSAASVSGLCGYTGVSWIEP